MKKEELIEEYKKELQLLAQDMSILLVEDDTVLRQQMKKVLEHFFSRVDCAGNGIEALAATEQRKYEMIITDLTMPYMNGITLSKELKARDARQSIIVVSAHNESEKLIELINLGVDGFVLKPLNIAHLLELLKKHCEALHNEAMKLRYSRLLDAAYTELKERSCALEETLRALAQAKGMKDITQEQEMSAEEFLELHKEDSLSLNEVMLDLEESFHLLLLHYTQQKGAQNIAEVSRILRRYSEIFEGLEFFHLLAEQLSFIVEMLEEIEDKEMLFTEMLVYFTEILEHFESFRREIFQYKTSKNIFSMVSLMLRQISTMRSTLHFLVTKDATQTQQYDFIIA